MARKEGEGQSGDAGGNGEGGGVHGLCDEELGHPLDVCDHASTFGYDARQRSEVPVHQYELGNGLGRFTAGTDGNTEVGGFESQCVVHAVTGHGHGAALVLQCPDHRLLLLRAGSPHDACGKNCVEQRLVISERTGINDGGRRIQAAQAGLHCDSGDGCGAVARNDLHVNTLPGEVVESRTGVVSDLLLEGDQCAGFKAFGQPFGRHGRIRRCQHQYPTPEFCAVRNLGEELVVLRGFRIKDHVGRAHHPASWLPLVHGKGGPLSGRREWDQRAGRIGSLLVTQIRLKGDAGGVSRSRRQSEQCPEHVSWIGVLHNGDVVHNGVALRQRSGFVEAHRVHAGQPFHRSEFLHQYP